MEALSIRQRMVKSFYEEAEVLQSGWGVKGGGLGGSGACRDGGGRHRRCGGRAVSAAAGGDQGQLLLALQGPQGVVGGDSGGLGAGVHGRGDRRVPPG